jgi:hypothetical protein
MRVIRHPKLADDIRDAAMHYAEISEIFELILAGA